jgi:Ser/Thr protein kinase RdoA (MazF antagonist)
MDRELAAAAWVPAAREALAAFGVAAQTLELAAVSENITFRAVDSAGAAYGVRLHRPGYNSLSALQAERAWTRALRAAGVAAPEALTMADGRDFVAVSAGGEARLAGLTRWIEGVVLDEMLGGDPDPRAAAPQLERLGALSAALHGQAERWRPPSGFNRRVLDADGLMGEAPSWGRFWEHPALTPAESRLFATTRERLHGELSRLPRTPAHFGVIHADLHSGNVLAGPDGNLSAIDFDDAAFGWFAYDLAVALSPYERTPAFGAFKEALLRGYRARRLFEDEALLRRFLLVRRLAVIGWLGQRPEIDPGARQAELVAAAVDGCLAIGEDG